MELKCARCGELKWEGDFLKRNQSLPYSKANVRCCRECNRESNKNRYHSNPEVKRKQTAASKAWVVAHPARVKERQDRFASENPENQRARNKVAHMIRRGYWTRQPCDVCGTAVGIEAHHDSYAEAHWTTVRWLCKDHHEKWHMIIDPVKKPMLSGLDEVEEMRAKYQDLFAQSNALREQARQLKKEADALELRTWTEVQIKAHELFQTFASQ